MSENQETINQVQVPEIERQADGTFKPGSTGNPKGRPRGISLARMIREELQDIPEGQTRTKLQMIVKVLMHKGINEKDIKAIQEIFDRGFGKAVQVMDFGGDEDIKEVSVKIVRNAEESK